MRKYIFLCFVILTVQSRAQVSGYMGKRLSIGYSNYFSPRFPVVKSILSEFYSEGSDAVIASRRSFHFTNSIDVDYILTSKVSLCMSGQFSKMDFCEYGSKFNLKEYNGSSNDYFDVYYAPPKSQSMDLKTTNLSIGFKFFKRGYDSPFGRYSKMEIVIVTDKVIMDKNQFYRDDTYYYPLTRGYKIPERPYAYKSFVFAYTFGKQRVLFDKLVLDYGLRIGFNYSYLITDGNVIASIINLTKEDQNKDITLDTRFKRIANVRAFESQLLNVHLGLRFLAF